MRSARLILLAAAVLAGLSTAPTAAYAQGGPPHLPEVKRTQCPHALQPPLSAPDRIRAALPTIIERQFGYQENPNGTSYKDWDLLAEMSLQPTYPASAVPGAAHLRAAAAARCGEQVADSSWLIVLVFPQMHLINSIGRFFVALTPGGWRIWAYD